MESLIPPQNHFNGNSVILKWRIIAPAFGGFYRAAGYLKGGSAVSLIVVRIKITAWTHPIPLLFEIAIHYNDTFPHIPLPLMSAAQDLTLLLVRDAAEPEMWIDIWARSYPLVQQVACAANEGIAQWQSKINTAWQLIPGQAMIVAHGAGVPAVMAW